jgi:uncharacterized protein (TIGR02271 family)
MTKKHTNDAISIEQHASTDGVRSAQSEKERIVVPVVAEQLAIGKRVIETGKVRLQKRVHTREEVVDEPLLHEEVQVERVERNELVEAAGPVRYEGEVMVVPVYEEVLVLEKRLLLKEELRISKRTHTVQEPQTVTLREEQVVVKRVASDNDGSAAEPLR